MSVTLIISPCQGRTALRATNTTYLFTRWRTILLEINDGEKSRKECELVYIFGIFMKTYQYIYYILTSTGKYILTSTGKYILTSTGKYILTSTGKPYSF